MKKSKAVIFVILLIILDQISKYFVRINLKDHEPITIIKNVFKLEYLENTGAAFGIFKNQIIFFILTTILVILVIAYFYYKVPEDKKYLPLKIIMIFITAGALGNLIDRVAFNYVTDFLYFELINFPVFNVADCYVTVSAFFLVILFIFYYKDEDLSFLSRKAPDSAILDEKAGTSSPKGK